MGDRQVGVADWAVPAVLVALGVGLFFAVGLILAVAAEDRSQAPPLVQELDTYTECLVDHGADVPRVEVGRNGGFTISIPSSLVEGEFDGSAWRHAADQCVGAAPEILGGLSGGFSGNWFEVVPEDMWEDIGSIAESVVVDEFDILEFGVHPRARRQGSHSQQAREAPLDVLERRCGRFADEKDFGDRAFGPRIDRLRRQCERLDR